MSEKLIVDMYKTLDKLKILGTDIVVEEIALEEHRDFIGVRNPSIQIQSKAIHTKAEIVTIPEGVTIFSLHKSLYPESANSTNNKPITEVETLIIPSSIFHLCRYVELKDYFPNIRSVIFREQSLVRKIPADFFSDLHYLEEVILPEGLDILGRGCFRYSSILNIVLPNSLTEIEDVAFSKTNIGSIELPDKLTKLGIKVFLGCSKLRSITLPRSLRTCNINILLNSGVETIIIEGYIYNFLDDFNIEGYKNLKCIECCNLDMHTYLKRSLPRSIRVRLIAGVDYYGR